eukprot:9540559-Karenia_brevis.AAC.1
MILRWARPALAALGTLSVKCSSAHPVHCMKRSQEPGRPATSSENTAAGAAFAEAVRESGASLPQAVLARLRASLLSRISSATP